MPYAINCGIVGIESLVYASGASNDNQLRISAVTVGWFAGRTCKNHNNRYTYLPKLLCSFTIHVLFTNVTAEHITQPGGPCVGHSAVRSLRWKNWRPRIRFGTVSIGTHCVMTDELRLRLMPRGLRCMNDTHYVPDCTQQEGNQLVIRLFL
jgi:hypothetical protein